MTLSLRFRTLLFFLFMACGGWVAIAFGTIFAWRRAPDALPALMTAAIAGAIGVGFIIALIWLLFDEHIARALTRLSASFRARAHGGVTKRLDIADLKHLGDLGPSAEAICDRLATVERDAQARLADAVAKAEAENERLAAILSDIPVAIMVVDEAHRIMLYDRQCTQALGHVKTLCLGRSIYDYLDRDALDAALADLAAEGRNGHVDVTLPTADGSSRIGARVRPAAGGRGFMLAIEVDEAVTDERPLVFDFDGNAAHASTDILQTPLSALSCVVFDCETTGLDTVRDDVVQIGAVRLRNNRLVRGEAIDTYVDPGRPIPPASTRVHGISDADVAGAPDIQTAVRSFDDFAHDAVLVAHNAPFDVAFLKRYGKPMGLAFDNPVLDTVLLSAAVFGETASHTLDDIADRLDVAIPEATRHTAMGDAKATADVLMKLVPVLEARGIRTFADADAAMRKHARLLPSLNQPAKVEA